MKIGFDFDNTIVCYDKTIEVLSKKLDLPNDLNRDKFSIKDYLRKYNREDEWTEFQGLIYGPGMQYAFMFEYFYNICDKLVNLNHELFIVSHRSRYPYKGEKHDLHFYAQQWIQINFKSKNLIKTENIFFLESLYWAEFMEEFLLQQRLQLLLQFMRF
jgi:hypothetical protein